MSLLPRPHAGNLLTAVFALGSALAAHRINRTAPRPYIDEIFHIPQAQRFCRDDWDQYDPKLTTPPGLYLVSLFLSRVLPLFDCSDVAFLRSTNLILLLCIPHLVAAILQSQEDERERRLIQNQARVLQSKGGSGRPVELPPAYSEQEVAGARSRLTMDGGQSHAPSVEPSPMPRSRRAGIPRETVRALQAQAKRDAQAAELAGTTAVSPPGNGQQERGETGPPNASPAPAPTAMAHAPSSLDSVLSSSSVHRKLRAQRNESWRLSVGHAVALLPPLWFFGFLYYTDVGSVFFVLSTYLASLRRQRLLAAAFGAVSLLFRQTNVVWLLYVAALGLLADVERTFSQMYDPLPADMGYTAPWHCIVSLVQLLTTRGAIAKLASLTLKHAAPFAPTFAGFAYFVHWNGSIVLGDQQNHQAGLHVVQLCYFLLFATGFGWPALLASQSRASGAIRRSDSIRQAFIDPIRLLVTGTARGLAGSPTALLLTATMAGACYLVVERFTIEHPFLLADNRHYTFYIWKNVWRRHELARFAMVSVYLICGRMWWDAAGRTTPLLPLLGLCLSTALTLVPSPLIEPRYFLIPYVFLRLLVVPDPPTAAESDEGKKDTHKWLWLGVEVGTSTLVNVATVLLFLHRPFEWPKDGVDISRGEGTTMRFMW